MKLTILATSDMHGYIKPSNFGAKEQDMPFGSAKVATIIKEKKAAAAGPVLTIENGDFIQGSPLSYYIARRKTPNDPSDLVNVLNLIDYDAAVLGNHEFNYGKDYLQQAIAAAKHSILAANIVNEEGKPAFGKAYEIFEKGGVKIAVLGMTTQYIPNWEHPTHIHGLTFKSIVDTAKEYVPKLRELADVVVVSYHGGFEKELKTGEPTEALTGEN
ncbi:MAG: metallophosphoesterase, partial [Carnobacterium sp.]|uniref:metallophosphoesterase n=1 Tax=Carnobacterium sp. TaxID=48221 RepID=UPI002FCB1CF8